MNGDKSQLVVSSFFVVVDIMLFDMKKKKKFPKEEEEGLNYEVVFISYISESEAFRQRAAFLSFGGRRRCRASVIR